MKKKILIALATIVAIILLLFAICFIVLGIASVKGFSVSEGLYLTADNGSNIIIMDNSPIVMRNCSKNEEVFEGLTNGDKILIIHDGIEESYPGGTGVYFCKKLSDGEYKDLPEKVVVSLIEMGYIDTPPITQENVNFHAVSYRSYNTPSGIMFPQKRIINSIEELNDYVNGFNGEFAEQCKKYDEKYFEEKSLIVVILEESSGSITHTVTDLKMSDDGKLYAYIDVNVPEAGDCDIAHWHIFIEPNAEISKNTTELEWTDIQLVFNRVQLGTGELVKVEKDNRMLSLVIPDGWEYRTHETAMDTEDLAYTFFIEFWPEGKNEGSILFGCDEHFGVCGTGLECKDVVIGGHNCSMGIYDNNDAWSFITIDVESDYDYFIWNYAENSWWNEYSTEAMKILDTLEYR